MSMEGKGKVLSLGEAIKRYVQPRMKVHLAGGIGGPSAAICEIIRQFRDASPEFTIIQSTLTGHALNLVHCRLVKKLICAVCADISSSARPSKIIQRADEDPSFTLENWTLNTLQQRLMAGAFDLPFMPTKSICGSSIAHENADDFKEIGDPFGSGDKTGIVKALHPDLSIVHGCVGDPDGNIIMLCPSGEDIWGPLASVKGVLVTVEKIVPTDFIREYAGLVKIPAYTVRAVCEAPLGLHPFSLPNPGIRDFEPYEQDTAFLDDLHDASLQPERLDGWIKEWSEDCADHQAYLDKLGAVRIAGLQGISMDLNGIRVPGPTDDGITDAPFESDEMMLVAIARETVDSIKKFGLELILSGAGSKAIAAWLAYYQLREEDYPIEMVTGNGQLGFTPLPGKSILLSEAGVRSSKILSDTVMTQGVFVGGKNNRCLSVLGAGQIDKWGNINSTKTSTGKFLVGSGGANDALNAREVILALDQSPTRFVERLSYVTGSGGHVRRVVSNMGIFKRSQPDEELTLVACLPDSAAVSLSQRIERIKKHCGWSLKTASDVKEVAVPTGAELSLLRWLLRRDQH